jgi:hypothetical protein
MDTGGAQGSLALVRRGAACVALGQLYWALAFHKAGCSSTWDRRLLLMLLLAPLDTCARAVVCSLCCCWCCTGAAALVTGVALVQRGAACVAMGQLHWALALRKAG